jgi:hypothetical protein
MASRANRGAIKAKRFMGSFLVTDLQLSGYMRSAVCRIIWLTEKSMTTNSPAAELYTAVPIEAILEIQQTPEIEPLELKPDWSKLPIQYWDDPQAF